MSDLSDLRERLHLDLERVLGAASIVELDADAMREAIIDALSIFDSAQGGQSYGDEIGSELRNAQALASAASRMAYRLRELHRVRVSSEPVEVEL